MERADLVSPQAGSIPLPPGIVSRYVMAGDIRTHYLEGGSGEPVVLIHSGEFSARAEFSWRYTLGPLAEHFHVYAPDMVGYGGTDKLYSFTDQRMLHIQHIRRFLEALCIPAAHFIGNSYAGGMILRAETMRPRPWAIRSIILASGGGRIPVTEYRQVLTNYDGTRDGMRKLLQVLFYDERWWAEEMVEERWRASIEPGAWEALAAARFNRPGAERSGFGDPLDESLVKCPVLITGGDQDLLRDPGCWEELHARIPQSELHVFSPGRHVPQIEFADEFNRLAIDFIQRQSRGA